jgi:hypothetical protein
MSKPKVTGVTIIGWRINEIYEAIFVKIDYEG